VLAAWLYWQHGRSAAKDSGMEHHASHGAQGHGHGEESSEAPGWVATTLATCHCGAGCALADIVVESLLFLGGITLLGSMLWASYLYDFLGAWTLGVVFQYFSIKPMTDLSPGQAIVAAIKADTLSILAFQVGMYAWMALTHFFLFPHLEANRPLYWGMMQVAMLLGFATAWPMNRWLVARGLKGSM
jgi:hypothetical protein